MNTTTMSVTLNNVTPTQFQAITELLENEETSTIDMSALKKKSKKTKPTKTVSDDEDEDFGKKAMKSKDLDDEDEEDDTEEDEEMETSDTDDDEDEESDDEEADEDGITFKEVKAAVNKYGEKHPDKMRALLLTFGMKSPKELSSTKNEKHWEPLYRKVMAKIKAAKKKG